MTTGRECSGFNRDGAVNGRGFVSRHNAVGNKLAAALALSDAAGSHSACSAKEVETDQEDETCGGGSVDNIGHRRCAERLCCLSLLFLTAGDFELFQLDQRSSAGVELDGKRDEMKND